MQYLYIVTVQSLILWLLVRHFIPYDRSLRSYGHTFLPFFNVQESWVVAVVATYHSIVFCHYLCNALLIHFHILLCDRHVDACDGYFPRTLLRHFQTFDAEVFLFSDATYCCKDYSLACRFTYLALALTRQ